jgi:dihydroxyacid dehydratase/phosphogluconate dehydratase
MTRLRRDEWYDGGDRNAYLRRHGCAGEYRLVLLGGCDTTIPAMLMATASVDRPAVVISGGSMLVGSRPADRAGWLEQLATRLDAAAEELVPHAAGRPTPVGSGCRAS